MAEARSSENETVSASEKAASEKAGCMLLPERDGRGLRSKSSFKITGQRTCRRRASTSDLSFLVCPIAAEQLSAPRRSMIFGGTLAGL